MIALLLGTAAAVMKSRQALILENLALRHQIGVLRRSVKQPRLKPSDRGLWVLLSRIWGGWERSLVLVKPETVIRWHRKGFRLYWKWKSRGLGRPRVSPEIRDLIRQMCRANPLWGAPRIHGELLKLGIEISQAAVSKYVVRHRRPPSQTWRAFLTNHARDIVSVDFFTVPTATFRVLFVFVMMSNERRRVVHFNVTTAPSAAWTGQQVVEAYPWEAAPRFLLRDRDGISGTDFVRRAKGLGIEQVVISARSPWQSPYVERVIGSIRRECLDHVIVLSEKQLRRVLRSYIAYYHGSRTHLGLEKDCPETRPVEPPHLGVIGAEPRVGGLHHRCFRGAA